MKPMTNLFGCAFVTAVILFSFGFLASKVPVAAAAIPADTVVVVESDPVATGFLVDVAPVRNNKGRVVVLVFDRKEAFEKYDYESAAAYAEIAATAGTLQVSFPELPTGSYAVVLFHDENEDGELNMDGLYPLEGYGTSGAKSSYHQPAFDEALVDSGRVSVRMYYTK